MELGRLKGYGLVLIGAAAFLAGTPAEAYYQYVHYLTRGAPYTPVFEKFDLTVLPNKTVTFLVADTGPATFAANDSFASVLSQIKEAAAAWNSVDSSDLRVVFGGLETPGQASNTPGGDVVFTDLPPGLLGLGGVTPAAAPVNGPNGQFFPVVRSTIMLTNDVSKEPGPSYLEEFFTTAVHEMGHALGLQHTFTGAAMSQAVIRNTTHARPLDADDRAGLSLLYGKASYAANVGSISGRVISNGQPVVLASVVALTATGPAISALTNPDGTYRIDGLLPNQQYLLYVHPIPPDSFDNDAIRRPKDVNGQPIQASGPFETLFYPATRDPQQATSVAVSAGSAVTGINFSVQPRNAVPVYDMITYSYSGQQALTPAYVSIGKAQSTIVAQARRPLPTPVPQSVMVLGFGNAGIRPYGSPVALALDLNRPFSPGVGSRHLIFNFGNDMYVLPYGLTLVQRDAPAISAVTPNGDGTVTIAGTNFGADSRVFFDGLPAAVQPPLSGDGTQGSFSVTPPPGFSGQVSTITVYNSDGQNSTFYQTQAPPTYTYPTSGTPQINVAPAILPAGAARMVDITAQNMQFADGQVTVGLGTDDVTVRRVWVLGPTHLVANVVAASGAAIGSSEISVISGFQVAVQPFAFQTQASVAGLPSLVLPVVNADPTQSTIFPGSFVSVYGANLALSANSAQVTLNDSAVPVQFASPNQVNFLVPANFPTGLAVLKLNNGGTTSLPVELQIDNPPPAIVSITNDQNQTVDATHVPNIGDTLTIAISSSDASLVGSQGRVRVTISGLDIPVSKVSAGPSGTILVSAVLTQSFGGAQVPVAVWVDGTRSNPVTIVAR